MNSNNLTHHVIFDWAINVRRKRDTADVRNIQQILLVSYSVTTHNCHSKYTDQTEFKHSNCSIYCNKKKWQASVQQNQQLEADNDEHKK